MRWLVLTLCAAAVALFGARSAISTVATSARDAAAPDIPQSYVFGSGKLSPLRPRVTYQASRFPIALRVTPPDASWGAAQWKANLFAPDEIARRHLKCSTTPVVCKPPYYGWVAIGPAGRYSGAPPGLIVILAGYSRVPSVATTVANYDAARISSSNQPILCGLQGSVDSSSKGRPREESTSSSPSRHRAKARPGAVQLT